MNDDGPESKAEPLRVPVPEVPVRNSIVAPEPDAGAQSRAESEPPPRPSVIPRPVHVVSDRPSAPDEVAAQDSSPPLQLADDLDPDATIQIAEDYAAPASVAASAAPSGPDDETQTPQGPDDRDAAWTHETLDLSPDDLDEADPPDPPHKPPPATPAKPPPPPVETRSSKPDTMELELDGEDGEEAVLIDLTEESEPAAAQRRQPTPPPPPLAPGLVGASPVRVAEVKPSKPRKQQWWEAFFDDDYLRSVRPPSREAVARKVDFLIERLGLTPGATVLDVGCGWGADVVELSSRGYLGVGLDLSLAMLSRAADEAQDRGQRINFLHADMREMNFDGTFDAVMCLGTTFGYFDDDLNRQVAGRLHRALKPQGVLLLEVVNRDHVIRSQPNLVWFEGDGCVCMEESEFNYFTSRLHVKRTVILDDGKQRENEYSVRLYSLHELGQMLHSQGFRVTEVSGRTALPGVFFGQESPRLLVVAERRADSGGGTNSGPPGSGDQFTDIE